jgi:hypothetical protein
MAVTATTIALAGLAVSAIGAGVAAVGQIEQGKAADKAGKYNAQVAENNALAAQQQAEFDAGRLRKRQLILLGKQRANFAKSGVELSGSATDVMYDCALEGELDRLAVFYTGNVTAGNQRARAGLERMEGSNAKATGYLNAGGTILTGAGRTASGYNRIQNPSFGAED